MHAVTLEQLEEISPHDRGADRGIVRGGRVVGRAGHDQFRHVHRDRERQGAGRAAGQGQAETLRPAAGRPGPGGHPGRRHPADLARLPRRPARRDPVPRHDRPAAHPVPGGHRRGRGPGRGRGHDRGLQRRPEQPGQLRPLAGAAALHRVGARLRLPGPDRLARPRPVRSGRTAVRRPDRLRHPPRGLRHPAPHHLDPLTRAARRPGPRVRRHHPRQGRQETGRAGRHPGPRQDPPPGQKSKRRSRRSRPGPGSAASSPGSSTATSQRTCAWPGPPTRPPAPRWKRKSSASTC